MSKLELFKNLKTAKDIENTFKLLEAYSDEYEINVQDLFKIDSDEYPNVRYVLSILNKKNVLNHYFEYSYNGTDVGLLSIKPDEKEFTKVSDAKYDKYSIFTETCILMMTSEGYFDLVCKDKVLLSNIDDVQEIGIQPKFSCLRLTLEDGNISLVCFDYLKKRPKLYFPSDIDEFREWYYEMIEELGYVGMLDDVEISEIVGVLYDVIGSCFLRRNYKPLPNLNYIN